MCSVKTACGGMSFCYPSYQPGGGGGGGGVEKGVHARMVQNRWTCELIYMERSMSLVDLYLKSKSIYLPKY